MVKYLEVLPSDKRVTHVKVELRYNKGGFNVFTCKEEPRGYYLSATPVERAERENGVVLEGFMAFSGIKTCIHHVTRKSDKQMKIAESLVSAYEDEMVRHICENNGLTLK